MVSENIKRIRKVKGITQKQLASDSGLSVTSIQYYECGKFKPKIEQVERLAAALHSYQIPEQGRSYLLVQQKSDGENQQQRKQNGSVPISC